jgi:hypothetical protein
MAAPYNIDPTSPSDSAIISQFPTNERAHRLTVKDFLETDHDNETGHHNWLVLVEQASDPSGVADMYTLYFKDGVLKYRDGTGSATNFGEWASGTKVPFYQAAPPTGYTQDTSITDRLLRVVSTTGGGTGGSWTISGVTVANHTLATTRIPSHSHTSDFLDSAGTGLASPGSGNTIGQRTESTSATGGTDPHAHGLTADGTWRPAYANLVIGTKNS